MRGDSVSGNTYVNVESSVRGIYPEETFELDSRSESWRTVDGVSLHGSTEGGKDGVY